jgi:hypothetical protein
LLCVDAIARQQALAHDPALEAAYLGRAEAAQ